MKYENLILDLINKKKKLKLIESSTEALNDQDIQKKIVSPSETSQLNLQGISAITVKALKAIKKKIKYFINKRNSIATLNLNDRLEERFPTPEEVQEQVSDFVKEQHLTKKELSVLSNLVIDNIVRKINIKFNYLDKNYTLALDKIIDLSEIEGIFQRYILNSEYEKLFGNQGVLSDQLSDDWEQTTKSTVLNYIKNYSVEHAAQNNIVLNTNDSDEVLRYFNSLNYNTLKVIFTKDGKAKSLLYRITTPKKLYNFFEKELENYENKILFLIGAKQEIKKIESTVKQEKIINPETITATNISGINLSDFKKIYDHNGVNFDRLVANSELKNQTRLTTGKTVNSNLIKSIYYLCQRYNLDDFDINYSLSTLTKYVNSSVESKIFNHTINSSEITGENKFCNWFKSEDLKDEINAKNLLSLDNKLLDIKNILDMQSFSVESIRSYYDKLINSRTPAISSNLAKAIFFMAARIKNLDIGSDTSNIPSGPIRKLIFSHDGKIFKEILNQYISQIDVNENLFHSLIINHNDFTLKSQLSESPELIEGAFEKHIIKNVNIELNSKNLTLNEFLNLDHTLEVSGKKITFRKFNIDRNERVFFESMSDSLFKKIFSTSEEENKLFSSTELQKIRESMHSSLFSHTPGGEINCKALIPLIVTKVLLQTNEYILDINRIFHSWEYEKNLELYLINNFKMLSSSTRERLLNSEEIEKNSYIINNLSSELKFSVDTNVKDLFVSKNNHYIIDDKKIYKRLGLSEKNIKSDLIFEKIIRGKDKTYTGAGEDLVILYLLGIDIIENLKIIQNKNSATDIDINSDSITQFISRFNLYSGDAASDDITFKSKLPQGIPEETSSEISNKIFEIKELKTISANIRTGSEGITAIAKLIGDIYQILDTIKEFVNETKEKSVEGKSLFSLILTYFQNNLPRKEFLDLTNKFKNFYTEFKDLIEEEESSERGKSSDSNVSLNIESGAYNKEKIKSLVEIYINIKNALKYIIKSYHSGKPSEDEKQSLMVQNLRNLSDRTSSVLIKDFDQNEFNAKLPFTISNENSELDLLINIEDILDLAHKSNNDKLIDHIFDTNNSSDIHKLVSRLAVKYYSKFSKIDTSKLYDIEKNDIKDLVNAEDCFRNIDGIFLLFNAGIKISLIYIPKQALNKYLVFTSSSQHRPNFALRKNTEVFKHFKSNALESN